MEKRNGTIKRETLLSFGTMRGIISDIINLLFIIALWAISKDKVGNVILAIFIVCGVLTIFSLGLDIYILRKHKRNKNLEENQ